MAGSNGPSAGDKVERIDVSWDYEVCAWARHFNTSQARVKEAVQAVGDRADRVRDHLMRDSASERPSAR
jgi:methyl-accepting chemotaxis protein